MFDPNKTYTIHIWDMPMCVVDDETEDYIRNEDGSVKLFCVHNYDFSYLCDGIDVDDLISHTPHELFVKDEDDDEL